MSFPTEDLTHGTEAVSHLTDHYRNQAVVPGILNALTPSIQELEGVFWSILQSFLLTNSPVGDQLNSIGSIVGAQRGFLTDAEYLVLVKLQILTNRSQGLSEDIIKIMTLAENGNGPLPGYHDITNPQFLVEAWSLPYPQIIWPLLSEARSVATGGVLHYTTWADGNDFEFTSAYASSSTGQAAFSSFYSSTIGGLMVASQAV